MHTYTYNAFPAFQGVAICLHKNAVWTLSLYQTMAHLGHVCLYNAWSHGGRLGWKSAAAWAHDVLGRILSAGGCGSPDSNPNGKRIAPDAKSLIFPTCRHESGGPSPRTFTHRRSSKHCSMRFTVESSAERMQARGS